MIDKTKLPGLNTAPTLRLLLIAVLIGSSLFLTVDALAASDRTGKQAETPKQPIKLEDTSRYGFDWQYAASFVLYDDCGDTSAGEWIRQVLVAKMEECPFTEAAKKNFYADAAQSSSNAMAELIAYLRIHKSMPTKTGGANHSCADKRSSEIEFRNKLEQYSQGKLSLSAFTPGDVASCSAEPNEVSAESLPPIHLYSSDNQPHGEMK